MVSRRYGFHSGSVHAREVVLNDGNAVSHPQILIGSGSPSFKAPIGSIYINYAASTSTTRMYINTNGGTTWAYFTASA